MVLRNFKVPKHGGPDGQGLPQEVFDELIKIFQNETVLDADAEKTMMLSFSAAKQQEWNEHYRPQLLELCVDLTNK